ncbi:MAG: DUF6261 family protein [Bacteroidales bacterium]
MKIQNLKVNARVAEVGGVATAIINIYSEVEEEFVDDVVLTDLMADLGASNDALTTAIEKDKAISKREEFDEARDQAYRAFYAIVKAAVYYPEKTQAESAQIVLNVFQKYGDITGKSYEEQTALTRSLLKELSSADVAYNSFSVPGFSTLKSNLQSAQMKYEKTYTDYLEAIEKSKEQDSASIVKPIVLDAINNKLLVYLRSAAVFSPDTHRVFAGQVATAVDKANQNVRARRTVISEFATGRG